MRYARLAMAALALVLVSGPAIAQEPHDGHAHDHGAEVVPATVPAGGWATDAPLRKGMREIASIVGALEQDDLGPGGAEALAGRIRAQVAVIVAECALPADADAALHPILGELAQAAGTLTAEPGTRASLPQLRAALADYARLFDDPGFTAP